jgi:eukaryotic-like serine/threonine-protein kinase
MALSATEWARVEKLFPLAVDLGAAERARFLDRECGAEPSVRAELEAMLEAAGTADPLLDRPLPLTTPGGAKQEERLETGMRLGSWKIRSLIGHGGMGEVYLAERADGAFAMAAAIKLLKRELFSFTNAQRFLRERRVLARLSHPNIARVLDAGTTDDGRPFLVMEYAPGSRLTDHSRARELSVRANVRLMRAVAEAVAEAHRHGVVHRDLKPANVLVSDDGQVKLLDFGIAHLPDEPEAVPSSAVPMTPAYAAPEQIRDEALSPATDVYALGVMLFQVLTHRLPHRREGLPLPVIAAGLRDEHPLAQAIAGDLDAIALKALAADPALRYPDAAAMAADLRRYLERRPVAARPPSWGYKAARFFQRLLLSGSRGA